MRELHFAALRVVARDELVGMELLMRPVASDAGFGMSSSWDGHGAYLLDLRGAVSDRRGPRARSKRNLKLPALKGKSDILAQCYSLSIGNGGYFPLFLRWFGEKGAGPIRQG